jgi:hypothetical protein
MSPGTAAAKSKLLGNWPLLILAMAIVPAVYRVLDFPSDIDPEYPEVDRPTFNRLPPLAYRLAAPGDRIDQVAVCLSAGAVVLTARGLLRSRGRLRRGLAVRGDKAAAGPDQRSSGISYWTVALALSVGVFWYAAIPSPTLDGWHGLGWQSIANPAAPVTERLILAVFALGLVVFIARSVRIAGRSASELLREQSVRRNVKLLATALILVGLRLAELPRVEPVGYWPRWALVWGLLAWDLALLRLTSLGRSPASGPRALGSHRRRLVSLATWGTAWYALAALGLAIGWYHRPLDQLKVVVPQRIYISAMPTYQGLEIAHRRHRFKTIINLFPEETPGRSPLLADELRFAHEHGIRYVANPGSVLDGTDFIEKALALAQDPDAWPILVHCHACYDRTPAWVGIYRFIVQGCPLIEILREMEQHRGSRPKASVTLLYNRILSALAPVSYAHDPTAQLLKRYAAGVTLDKNRWATATTSSAENGVSSFFWAKKNGLTPFSSVACRHETSASTMCPATSVRRKSRPW